MAGKKGQGAPRFRVEGEKVYQAAKIGCSRKEIAALCLCSTTHLDNHFRKELEAGWADMAKSLKRAMFQNATDNMNAAVQIWLSKNYLGMREPPKDVEEDDSRAVDELKFNVVKAESEYEVEEQDQDDQEEDTE